MADDQGKIGSEQNEKPEKGEKDYASKMWKKIEQKSALKQERTELRGEFPDKPKKRRRRRRRKGGGEVKPDVVKHEVKHEMKSEVKTEIKPEVRHEVKPEPKPEVKPEVVQEQKPEAAPVMPINPFATSKPEIPSVTNLPGRILAEPPKEEQPKKEERSADVSPMNPFDRLPMEPADEGDEIGPQMPQAPSQVPINPFDSVPKRENVPPKEAKEIPMSDVEDVSQDSYAEEDQAAEIDKQERNVIDVEPAEEEFAEATKEFPAVAIAESGQADDFKEEFWTILEQAGITKRRILIFFISLVVIVLGLILFFSFYGGSGKVDEKAGEEWSEESDNETTRIPEIGETSGITAANIIGLQYTKIGSTKGFDVKIPLNTAFIFGKLVEVKREGFVGHVDLLRRMDNLYNTDIYNLVNLSLDRRETLNNFLLEMDAAINEGLVTYNLLGQQLLTLDSEYSRITEQRDLYEVGFFADLDAFRGQDAYNKMTLFVQFSQTALEIKADYNGKKIIRDKLVLSLNALRPRYSDILTNSEAIIKGVKVFDVPDSDIDAIVPVVE